MKVYFPVSPEQTAAFLGQALTGDLYGQDCIEYDLSGVDDAARWD